MSTLTVEALSDAISQSHNWYALTATAQAKCLLPFIERHITTGQQGAFDERLDTLILQYGNARATEVRALKNGTPQQQKDAKDASADAYIKIREHLLATPQPPKPACPCNLVTCVDPWEPGCGLGTSEDHVRVATPKPAGAVPLPEPPKPTTVHPGLGELWGRFELNRHAVDYSDACAAAREAAAIIKSSYSNSSNTCVDSAEAAGRADAVPAGCVADMPSFQRWNMAHGSDGARWSVYMDHADKGEWVKWQHVQQWFFAANLPQQPEADPDDIAVDRFAMAMKEKMAAARAKGRGGWEGPTCNAQLLSDMLRDHVAKGDPRDVANFCMMLWNRGEAIQAPAPQQMTTQGGSREAAMVVIQRDDRGRPSVWSDPEIVDLVTALNAGGIATAASCSGHGEKHGNIALKDGRELLIAENFGEARAMEAKLKAAGATP